MFNINNIEQDMTILSYQALLFMMLTTHIEF